MRKNEKNEKNIEEQLETLMSIIRDLELRVRQLERPNSDIKNNPIPNRKNIVDLNLPKSISESFGTINSRPYRD